jgi:hypothetical protein
MPGRNLLAFVFFFFLINCKEWKAGGPFKLFDSTRDTSSNISTRLEYNANVQHGLTPHVK